MIERVEIIVEGVAVPFELDFESRSWTAERQFAESDFPLVAEVNERRYELYSDGTFAEEER